MQSIQQHLFIRTLNHQTRKGLLLTAEQPGSLGDDGRFPEQRKQTGSTSEVLLHCTCRCEWYCQQHSHMLELLT